MNERIKQLLTQTTLHRNDHTTEQRLAELSKFAGLIVRDVLVICDAISEPFGDPEMDKNIPGASLVAEMVRENFRRVNE